jgi:hypothetical protein
MLGNTPDTTNTELPNGSQGNLETISFMKKLARLRSRHPLIRELALKILQTFKVPSHYYKDEALAIARYVKEKVRYVRDIQSVETIIDPILLVEQLKRGEAQGDCDDIATLIATLLLSIGHQPFFRIIKYKNTPEAESYNHVYVVAYEKNLGEEKRQRLVLDGIVKHKRIGYEIKHVLGKEIAV